MQSVDLTLPTPEQNLACDEALLEWCEQGHGEELLRFWESPEYFVVLGYSGKAASEVNLSACRKTRVPVLRRCSGGGAVVQGPGCLNYSLILQIADRAALRGITETNCFVMRRHREVLESIVGAEIAVQGFTDLALGGRKFSGNSQHRKRRFLLFHGTLLLDFDIPRMDELLPLPSRQPAYRQNRSHGDFLTNLNAPASVIEEALKSSWNVTGTLDKIPVGKIDELVARRYGREEWNFKF